MIDDDEYDSNGQVSGSQSVKKSLKSHFLTAVSIKIGFFTVESKQKLLHSSYNFIIHYK